MSRDESPFPPFRLTGDESARPHGTAPGFGILWSSKAWRYLSLARSQPDRHVMRDAARARTAAHQGLARQTTSLSLGARVLAPSARYGGMVASLIGRRPTRASIDWPCPHLGTARHLPPMAAAIPDRPTNLADRHGDSSRPRLFDCLTRGGRQCWPRVMPDGRKIAFFPSASFLGRAVLPMLKPAYRAHSPQDAQSAFDSLQFSSAVPEPYARASP